VLLATHDAVVPETESPSGDSGDGNGNGDTGGDGVELVADQRLALLTRLRLLAWLFENRWKTQVVLEFLQRRGARAGPADWITELARLALRDDWSAIAQALRGASWDRLQNGVEAWIEAERVAAREVGKVIKAAVDRIDKEDDAVELEQPSDPELVFEDEPTTTTQESSERTALSRLFGLGRQHTVERGRAGRAIALSYAPEQYEPAPKRRSLAAVLLETNAASGRMVLAYLAGPAQRWEFDVERIKNRVEHKRMIALAITASATIEPVGYLHLEKLFFEPLGVELGELVQAIPLMPGETRRFTHTEWSNTRSEYSKLVTESIEKLAEQSLAETSELTESTNAESSRDLAFSLASSISGSYGTVSFSVTAGLNVNQSESQSRQTSATRSREITEKASSRSKEERKVEFQFTTEEGTSDVAFQEVTNQTANPVTWAYHRLMTKWQVTLARYGVRLTYDLIIPDPANRLLRQYQRLHDLREKLAAAAAFSLSPSEITLAGWQDISAQYGVPIEPPPPEQVAIVAAANHSEPQASTFEAATLSLTAPTGYVFNGGWSAQWWAGGYGQDAWPQIDPNTGYNADRINGVSGTFPWEYHLHWPADTSGGAAFLQVRAGATLTPEAFQAWQTNSWEKAYDAYLGTRERQRGEWRRELEELESNLGDVDALTLRKKEHEEIMRVALAWLIGPTFDFYPDDLPMPFDLLGPDIGLYTGEGQIRSGTVHEAFLRHGELIRFLHQAVEWENLIYVVYPYFWTHERRWDAKDDVRHPDFVRQTFLRAGAARVVLTVRRGFEDAFLAYVTNAALNEPLPANHPYVTVAEELRNLANTSYPYTPAATPPDPANIVDTWNEFTPTPALYVNELAP
jgi:hypothetical protein